MTTIPIISQIVNLFGGTCNMVGISLKEKRKILILFTIGNSLVATALGLLGAVTGMCIQISFVVETIINFFFEKKYDKYPIWLIEVYTLIPIVILILTFSSFWDILPIIASILFVISMVSKNFLLRLLSLLSVIMWIPYNIIFTQYVGAGTCLVMAIINFIAIVRYDIINRRKVKNERN